jgi:hypothetical protein
MARALRTFPLYPAREYKSFDSHFKEKDEL